MWLHTTLEDPWPHCMILEVCWDSLWTLSFRLSEFQGHGSWLVCEVVLNGLNQDYGRPENIIMFIAILTLC